MIDLVDPKGNDLSRLTLVIPTLRRPRYVARQIEYWRQQPISLLILDGSAQPSVVLADHPGERLTYLHGPESFTARMRAACDAVTTEFVALCGDDDLYLPSGLTACIERLDHDSGMVGCVGRSLRFSHDGRRLYAQFINRSNEDSSQRFSSGIERVLNSYHSDKLDNPMFGVYRSAAWRESVSFTYSLEATTAYLYEFVLLILLPFRGSIGIANHLTWMASAENVSTMKASEFNREVGMLEWLDRPEYSAEVSQAKHAIVMELQRLSEQSYEVLEETVSQVLGQLVERYTKKSHLSHRLSPRRAMRHVLPLLPNRFKIALKNQLPTFMRERFGFGIIPWKSVMEQLDVSRIHYKIDELTLFEKTVLSDQESTRQINSR